MRGRSGRANAPPAGTIRSHECGFEVPLVVSGDSRPRTEVCRTHEAMIAAQETWRAALEERLGSHDERSWAQLTDRRNGEPVCAMPSSGPSVRQPHYPGLRRKMAQADACYGFSPRRHTAESSCARFSDTPAPLRDVRAAI